MSNVARRLRDALLWCAWFILQVGRAIDHAVRWGQPG
jgi:hypothetical protein